MSRRLTVYEIVEEVEWLLDGGMHPLMICKQMGRTLSGIDRAARRVGNERVARVFARHYAEERLRKARAA